MPSSDTETATCGPSRVAVNRMLTEGHAGELEELIRSARELQRELQKGPTG